MTVNRNNWKDVCQHLSYLENEKQLDPQTIKRRRGYLRHLLEWADNRPFTDSRNIQPTFPAYLLHARNDGAKKPLSAASMDQACGAARCFFTWARSELPKKYHALSESWVNTLHPSRAHSRQSELNEHEYYTLEAVEKIAALQLETLSNMRTQAATCLLFLSGMRISAFVTLPINCLDLVNLKIKQLPKLGVRTKNSKAAVTAMISIPSLLEVARKWDQLVRSQLPETSRWFAFLSRDGMSLVDKDTVGLSRRDQFSIGLKRLCKLAGVTYYSPHKLRHGFAMYAISKAKTAQELKAVSQNLMHASLTITDSVYGVLTDTDVHGVITSLGRGGQDEQTITESNYAEKFDQLFELIETLKKEKGH